MENNQFEKEVHNRMREFKIQPPDSVWQHIEKKIQRPASRRKGLVLIFLLLLLGTAAILFLPIRQQNTQSNAYTKSSTQKNINAGKTPPKEKGIKPENESAIATPGKNSLPGQKNSKGNETIHQDIAGSQQDITTHQQNISKPRQDIAVSGRNYSMELLNHAEINQQENDIQDIFIPIHTQKSSPGIVAALPKIYIAALSLQLPTIDHPISENQLPIISRNQHLPDLVEIKKQIALADKDTSSKKYSWSFGISFTPAISMIHHGLPGQKAAPSNANYLNYYSLSNRPVVFLPEPELKHAFGFSAGFMAKKYISEKSNLILGLNYKYASLSLQVGEQIDSVSLENNLRFNADSHQNIYKNVFHFIEIPVTYELKLGKPLKIPLLLQAGVHGAVLIHSNALQIQQGQYQSNIAQLSKFQFGLDAALMANIISGKKIQIKAGPWLQYNLTQMDNENIFGNTYLNMLGIKTEIFFGK